MSDESIDLLKLWQQLRKERDQIQADYDQKFSAMQARHRAKRDVAFMDRAVFDEDNNSLRVALEELNSSKERLAQFEKEHPSVLRR